MMSPQCSAGKCNLCRMSSCMCDCHFEGVKIINPELSKALDKIIGKLQDVKFCISDCSAFVHREGEEMDSFMLWVGDLEFMERLIGDFMSERGLRTCKTPITRHKHFERKVKALDVSLLEEEWIGRKHV